MRLQPLTHYPTGSNCNAYTHTLVGSAKSNIVGETGQSCHELVAKGCAYKFVCDGQCEFLK